MEARRSEKSRQDEASLEAPEFRPVPLGRWLWRAYLRSALFPILAIEIGFLATYWISTLITYRTNIGVIRPAAEDDFARMAQREALAIDGRLAAITELTSLFAEQATRALAQPYERRRMSCSAIRSRPSAAMRRNRRMAMARPPRSTRAPRRWPPSSSKRSNAARSSIRSCARSSRPIR